MTPGSNTIFEWRDNWNRDAWESTCPWCKTKTFLLRGPEDDDINTQRRCECPLCGWHASRYIWLSKVTGSFDGLYSMTVLRNFEDLNSVKLSIEEVGSYLKRSVTDAYSLDWRRFEEVVKWIFQRQGLETMLTQRTRDGRADVFLLTNGTTQAIVECKKYAHSRMLLVKAVRSLVGIDLNLKSRRAYLVTTNTESAAAQLNVGEVQGKGHYIDMVAATELAQLLGVYNASLPRLDKLDSAARTKIISQWRSPY